MDSQETFKSSPGFCIDCGSILPLLREKGEITCYACGKEYLADIFENSKVHYIIYFNSQEAFKESTDKRQVREENKGPVVDRKCIKCGNDKMSYATLQLRSADEGQTVFYTCTKCNYKETENS